MLLPYKTEKGRIFHLTDTFTKSILFYSRGRNARAREMQARKYGKKDGLTACPILTCSHLAQRALPSPKTIYIRYIYKPGASALERDPNLNTNQLSRALPKLYFTPPKAGRGGGGLGAQLDISFQVKLYANHGQLPKIAYIAYATTRKLRA